MFQFNRPLEANVLRLMAGRNRRLEVSGLPLGAVSCVRRLVGSQFVFNV